MISGSNSSLCCPLQQAATTAPETVFLETEVERCTYAAVYQKVNQLQATLRLHEIQQGDTCALWAENTPKTVLILLACIRTGILVLPLQPGMPEDALCNRLQEIACTHLILPEKQHALFEKKDLKLLTREALFTTGSDSPEHVHALPATRPATMILTSGSSASPKAAVHSLGNHLVNATRANQNIPLQQGDRWLLSLPLHHVAGLGVLFRCQLAQATVAFPAAGESLQESILRVRPTHLSLVATQLYRLLQDKTLLPALQQCKAILLGGGPIPEALIREASDAKLPIYTSYGLTEAATQVCTTATDDTLDHLLSSGSPLFPKQFRITDTGEIQIRGDSLFLGYREGEEITRPVTSDGWFATRDKGFLDGDGYLHVNGRMDNMFIAGGENVQPESIEAVLETLPSIQRAIVVPVAHLEFGASPAAFILWDQAALSLETLKQQLNDLLPSHALPQHIFPWPEDIDKDRIKAPRRDLEKLAKQFLAQP